MPRPGIPFSDAIAHAISTFETTSKNSLPLGSGFFEGSARLNVIASNAPLDQRNPRNKRHLCSGCPLPLFRGVAKAALYCAHRATTASSWGLCEQEGHLAAPSPSFSGRALHEHQDIQSSLIHSLRADVVCLRLRASNEHLLSVRVLRAMKVTTSALATSSSTRTPSSTDSSSVV